MRHLIGVILMWSVSAIAVAAPNGSNLYRDYCSACHGSNGSGGVGVPLALPDFIDRVSDQYLLKTIRYGRPDRVMPAFEDLSDAQLSSIVAHMRTWSKKKAPVYKADLIKGDSKKGYALFDQHCKSCHGENAQGGTGTGVTFSRKRDLPIVAPALGNSGFLKSATDEMIKDTIMHGRKGSPMRSFSKQLGESSINDIVAYIRSLQTKTVHHVDTDKEPDSLIYESADSLEDTLATIKNAIIGSNFKVIRVQKFEQGYVEKGKEDEKKIIVYFCSFSMLDQALRLDPRVGLFLPCRITLLQTGNKVKMYSINPAAMSHMFNNVELKLMCDELSQKYRDIMEEASL